MKKKKTVKKKKGFSFGKMYSDSWGYIKDSRKYIWSVVILFFVFGLIGLVFPAPDYVAEQINEMIRQLLEQTQDLRGWSLIGFIFFNNVQAGFFGIVFGLLLGIFPLVATVFNGYLVGYVGRIVSEQESIWVLWQLLPHGIFELPAIFISFGLGVRLGWFYLEKGNNDWKYYVLNSLKVFVFVVIPLLVVAAVIEGGLMTLALNGS